MGNIESAPSRVRNRHSLPALPARAEPLARPGTRTGSSFEAETTRWSTDASTILTDDTGKRHQIYGCERQGSPDRRLSSRPGSSLSLFGTPDSVSFNLDSLTQSIDQFSILTDDTGQRHRLWSFDIGTPPTSLRGTSRGVVTIGHDQLDSNSPALADIPNTETDSGRREETSRASPAVTPVSSELENAPRSVPRAPRLRQERVNKLYRAGGWGALTKLFGRNLQRKRPLEWHEEPSTASPAPTLISSKPPDAPYPLQRDLDILQQKLKHLTLPQPSPLRRDLLRFTQRSIRIAVFGRSASDRPILVNALHGQDESVRLSCHNIPHSLQSVQDLERYDYDALVVLWSTWEAHDYAPEAVLTARKRGKPVFLVATSMTNERGARTKEFWEMWKAELRVQLETEFMRVFREWSEETREYAEGMKGGVIFRVYLVGLETLRRMGMKGEREKVERGDVLDEEAFLEALVAGASKRLTNTSMTTEWFGAP